MIDWRRFIRRLGVALNFREPPNIPPYGWAYFDHLVSLYVTLNSSDSRADTVIKKSSADPDHLTWGDIFLLENIVFSLQPPEIIDRNAWIVRERFREIAGPNVYDKYLESNIPKDADTPARLTLLRADLTRVLDVLHWYYSLIPMRERIRKALTMRCIAYVIFYTVALAGILIVCHLYHAEFFAMLTGVVYWGILGGFVSSQRRMQRIPNDGDPLISVFGLDSAGYYLWLSPLLGAISAVVLLMMFIGGILQGSIFPAFYTPVAHHTGLPFFTFTWTTLPSSSTEYAKLFVWAFLGGFAERLVPDSLDRLSSKVAPPDKKRPSPRSPAGGDGHHSLASLDHVPDQKITPEVLETVMHTGETPAPPGTENGQK